MNSISRRKTGIKSRKDRMHVEDYKPVFPRKLRGIRVLRNQWFNGTDRESTLRRSGTQQFKKLVNLQACSARRFADGPGRAKNYRGNLQVRWR